MNRELVSVVIPCYNDHLYIRECVDSVLNQSYSNIELILVDDGSNTITKNVLKSIVHPRVTIYEQVNNGQSSARNYGIKNAKGKFILFVDSDDTIAPSFCKKLLHNYNTNYAVVTSNANIIINNKISYVFKPIGGNLKEALKHNIALGTSMFLKEDLNNIGGYDETMSSGFEDWEMLIRLLSHTKKEVFVVDEPLYNYTKGKVSTTTQANKIKYELLNYIYTKHQDLYKVYFKDFIDFLLKKLEREEQEKLKIYQRIEYRIGFKILYPLRFVKQWFKK